MYLRLNTQYNPFTYDELVKPLADYGKAYKEAEDVYTTLSSQTESFKDMVNQNINSEAYNMYKGYSDDLNKALDDFSKGMTSSNRAKLLELKKRYAGEIIPIARASQALKEANEFRDKAGPDAIFEVGRYKSLDDFLHGKIANNKYTTMSQISSRAKEKAQAVGAVIYNNLIRQGKSPQTALAIIQNPNSQVFKDIYDKELETIGISNYDTEGQNKITNAINVGISSALGKLLEGEIMTAAQRDASARAWEQLRESKRLHDIELAEKGYIRDKNGNFIKIPTPSAYTPVDLKGNPYNIDVVNELYGSREEHDQYAKYFDKNGNLTPDGLNVYNTPVDVTSYPSISGIPFKSKAHSSFASFMNRLAGKQSLTKEEIEKAYKENAKRFEAIKNIDFDTIRNTAYHVAFRDNNHIEKIIQGIPNSSKLPTYKYTKDGYIKSKNINIHDSKFEGATYSGEYGPKGNFIVITTNKGEKYKVPLRTVHQALDASIYSIFEDVNNFYLKKEGDSNSLYSDEELDKLIPYGSTYTTRRDLIKSRLNNALDNFTAAFEEIQTEPYKVEGGLHNGQK